MIYNCKLYEQLLKYMEENKVDAATVSMYTELPFDQINHVVNKTGKIGKNALARIAKYLNSDDAIIKSGFLFEYTEEEVPTPRRKEKNGKSKRKA